MRVVDIIIDGFKSYAVRTVISGWDPTFNSITGLNGSGKSNILDAICFVLGITSMSTMRAQNIQVSKCNDLGRGIMLKGARISFINAVKPG